MKKTLFLIRHAKSSWSDPSLDDFDRPLNERGKKDAPNMGKVLAEKSPGIQLFLSSTAKRAIKTAKSVAKHYGFEENNIVAEDKLYHAAPHQILKLIAKHAKGKDSIAVFAHNPGLTDLANQLSSARIDNLPTAGIFAVEFDIENWDEISEKRGKFLYFEYPKKQKKVKIS
ncbi:MAG: histidine phosphatase family protein [Saprospiraceae bacterium]|nr:histidine phosphatase family protein [Saprospiraceae bacterium]